MMVMTLVHGGSHHDRETAIAARVEQGGAAAIIEGLPNGTSLLEPLAASGLLQLQRIAPGCPCCLGNLTVRVSLNRMLRQAPDRLYLSLADGSHLPAVRDFLQGEQYRERLRLGPEIDCSPDA
jgi:hypothetical protein